MPFNFEKYRSLSLYDFFGVNFHFRINNHVKHKSKTGGIFTLLFLVIATGIIIDNAYNFFSESETIVNVLKKDLEDGTIGRYITQYMDHIKSIPKEDCTFCDGLGVRTWKQQDANGLEEDVTKPCNACNGTLKVDNFDIQKIKLNSWDTLFKNEGLTNQLKIENLSKEIQDVFNNRTVWDNKIYNTFIK